MRVHKYVLTYFQQPPEKVTEDVQPVPWTEKEVLTYDVPVLDTEKAGLGI
jgi:hypothetical protein